MCVVRKHVCCMQNASLIFISGYKSRWLCCSTGHCSAACMQRGGRRGCRGGRRALRVHSFPEPSSPRLDIWIFMSRNYCSWGDPCHLARAAALHRKRSCLTQSWMFLNVAKYGRLCHPQTSTALLSHLLPQQNMTPEEWQLGIQISSNFRNKWLTMLTNSSRAIVNNLWNSDLLPFFIQCFLITWPMFSAKSQ